MLAVLAQATLGAGGVGDADRNVRTVVGQEWIKEVTRKEGWVVGDEVTVIPPKAMADGRWEVEAAVGNDFQKRLEEVAERDASLGSVLHGIKEALRMAIVAIGGSVNEVETMNVWSANMRRGNYDK